MAIPKILVALLVCLGGLSAENLTGVDALIEAGHFKQARQISLARLTTNPNDAQAHFWLSKVASVFDDLDTAIREAERAIALDPNNARFHGQLAESCALMADKAHVLKSFPYVRRMNKEVSSALALDPKQVDTLLVEMMFDWKAPGIAGGDKQRAFQIADRIVGISPAWGHLAQARLLQMKGDPAATEIALKQAVQADPSFYRARVSLAQFYCGERSCPAPAKAARSAMDAIAVDPGAAAAYNVLARAYAAESRWADLEQLVRRAEKAVPDDLGPTYIAGNELLNAGQDFDHAQRYLQHYLDQPAEGRQPTHAEARRLLADLYRRAGRETARVFRPVGTSQGQP